MKLSRIAALSALTSVLLAAPAFATPDIYVVNFRHAEDAKSQQLDTSLPDVIRMSQIEVEEIVIDTTTAAKWEKSAHDAFNRDIVPVFNKWVGLPGFAAVVDPQSKSVMGCLNAAGDPVTLAKELRNMAARSKGQAYASNASTSAALTQCPKTYNLPPVR
ncbi:hypothetical protein [uncultured Algimonas sp.]|uniref:hypothetical protein n=1 Tax=uncultured Algimonas sp. TaxID=1547920 RepID=UPI00261EE98E|nr:hypothetical protein [uncultured Algimonas sp.]